MKVFALLILISLLAACSSPVDKAECPCKVKVRVLQKDGTYALETVELKTLEDLHAIQSSKIRVTMNPRFFNDGTVSESTPEAQFFINEDSVIVPKTALSEQMFTLYKIMEDLFFFDKTIGVDQILTYPRTISIQEKSGEGVKDNAFYKTAYDRIEILTYNGKKAPLAWNSGVIAHEHFHAIFENIVKPTQNTVGLDYEGTAFTSQQAADSMDDETGYNYLILKSLNEGLADYWASLHTGLSDSYQTSYDEKENHRKVLPVVHQISDQDNLKNLFDFRSYVMENILSKGKNRPINGLVYEKSELYSNLFKSMSDKLFPEDKSVNAVDRKKAQGEWIVSSLRRLSDVVYVKGKFQTLSQADILSAFVPEDKTNRSELCADLNLFLTHHNKVPACSGQ
jgi:hypothetical protein